MHRQKGLSRDCPFRCLTSEAEGSRVFFLCHFLSLKPSLNRENQIVI